MDKNFFPLLPRTGQNSKKNLSQNSKNSDNNFKNLKFKITSFYPSLDKDLITLFHFSLM